jgi:two-component system, NtrC family, nitrogen regulation sensor histidine kinase NtrY
MAFERLAQSRFKFPLAICVIILPVFAGYLAAQSRYTQALIIFSAGLVAFLILLWLNHHTERTISFFFSALRNNDTALHFPVNIQNKALARLHESMNLTNLHFQKIKMQNEYNENYYRALIKNINSGFLVLYNDQIELINQAACRYAGISPESTNPNQLKIKNPKFYEAVYNLKAGETITYKQVIGNDYQLLNFRASFLSKNGLSLKLISIQDIRYEMESRELESYRKLISVLTHEIMNVVSPLTSVSKSLQSLYMNDGKAISISEFDEQILKTTQYGLQLIEEQSKGLTTFVENYRKISRIPQPLVQSIEIGEWLEQLRIVFGGRMNENQIIFNIASDPFVRQFSADKNLLNQVMINLVNNAIDAVMELKENREISLGITLFQQNRIHIKISNNGPVIQPEILDKIFVPFFTTKKNGSGVGLSICQEILKLHRGSITVISNEGLTSFIAEL